MGQLDEMVAEATLDELEVDFSEAVDFEPFAGKFPVVVTEVEAGKAQTSGQPKAIFHLEVTDGEYQGKSVKGRKIQLFDMAAGKGSGMLRRDLRALGLDPDVPGFRLRLTGPDSPVGRTAIAVCEIKDDSDFTDVKKLESDHSALGGTSVVASAATLG